MKILVLIIFIFSFISCEKNKKNITLYENNNLQNIEVLEYNNMNIYNEFISKTMYVNSKEGLRKRDEPSVNGNVLGTLSYGEKVIIDKISKITDTIDNITDYWYGIENDNDTWIFGGYLSEIFPNDAFDILGMWESKSYSREVIEFKSNYEYGDFYKESSMGVWGTYEINENKINVHLTQGGDDHDFATLDIIVEIIFTIIDNNNVVLKFSDNRTSEFKRIFELY
jgi:hypothetical protein